MWISYSVFVGEGPTLAEVVACVGEFTGYRLEHSIQDDGDYFEHATRFLEIAAYGDHHYEADQGMDFPRYPTYVGFSTWGGTDSDLRIDLCRVLALLTAGVIARTLTCECLVSRDLFELVKLIPKPG